MHGGILCLVGRLLPLEDAAAARFIARFLLVADGLSARPRFGLFGLFTSHILVFVDPTTESAKMS